jgi:hypothetical protein
MKEPNPSGIPASSKVKPGLTWKSVLALVFAAATILPVNLYLQLVSGATIASAATYITLVVLTELGAMLGSPITKQEAFIMFMLTSIVAGSPVYINFVYRSYFVTSPITWTFRDPCTGKPLPEVVPSFWAPPYNSPAHALRSLLHPDFILPQLISHLQFGVLFIVMEIALTMFVSSLYLEAEPLPFPLAEVNYSLIETLAERTEERMGIFIVSMIVGAFYSFIAYGIPTIMMGLFNVSMQLIPIPWIDLTMGYWGVEKFLPGACFGISTDILTFATGFILPLRVLAYIMVGSVATWVFGNWLALTTFKPYFPEWVSEWKSGMSLSLVWQRSLLRVWIGPQIGFVIGLSILSFVWSYKAIGKAVKSIVKISFARGSPSAMRWSLPMFIGAALCSLIFFHMLVPDFPLYIAALTIPLSFLLAVVVTRVRGETTVYAYPPYLWWILIYASGYPKVDAFFFQPVIGGSSTPLWTEALKVARLTDTRETDFFKGFILAWVLYCVFSLIFVQFFWLMAPIPSYVYPWTVISWPIQAITESMWHTRQITARVDTMLFGFTLVLALGGLQLALARLTGFTLDIVSLISGTATIPPAAVSMLIGGLLGNYVLRKAMGETRWREERALMVAGIATGGGIVTGILAALVLMFKSAWLKPF